MIKLCRLRHAVGESGKHRAEPEDYYSPQAQAQAHAVAALMEELGVFQAVLAGYDVGSPVAQTLAAIRPELVKALVVSPPLPGAGERVLQVTCTELPGVGHFRPLEATDKSAEAIRQRVDARVVSS
jgi:pimeloyl-ACP methyl ester carboxylesterase